MEESTSDLLLGDDRERSKYWAIGAGVFGLVSWLLLPLVGPLGWLLTVAGLAAIQSYDNRGLLLSWTIAFCAAAVFAFLVTRAVPVDGATRTIPEAIYTALVAGTLAAAIWGSIGFAVGMLLRRFV